MTHARKTIRDSAVTTLTGLTTTGARVHNTRIFALSESGLPCLAIYTGEEIVERASMGDLLERRVELMVHCYARAASGVEDVLDLISEEVETALTSLTGAKDIVLSRSAPEYSDEGDMPIATRSLTFDVTYYTAIGAPGAAL